MTVGLLRLYAATGKEVYLKMAGLAAAWLLGGNIAHQTMYDSITGRCYDGIRDSSTLNRNSGAESTIEALATLVELEHYPAAMKYLAFRKVYEKSTPRYRYAVFQNAGGDELTLVIDLVNANLRCLEGRASRRFRSQMEKP
jgi:hypothetical protein